MTPARIVVATAGHVDHGKTRLMRALTGVDTDRLPEEKRRGISIELGFAELPEQGISFIDVPGHRKLVHAMIAGMGGVDAALLVVAADDGVMPQTREHLLVCRLLGIDHVIVAISKADLVDEETLELCRADIEAAFEELGATATEIVVTSATTGAGVETLKDVLVRLKGTLPIRAESSRTWLAADRVFTIKGAGTVVTGTLTRGALTTGAEVYLVGAEGSAPAVCRALEEHGRAVERAAAPGRVAVNLARLDARPERGTVLSLDPELRPSVRCLAQLTVVPGAEEELVDRKPVTIHIGTARTRGRLRWLAPGLAQLTLDTPLPVEGGVGVVLRGFAPVRDRGAVLAGGRILDSHAPPLPRRRTLPAWARHVGAAEAIATQDPAAAVSALLTLESPRPLAASDIERRLGLEPGRVAQLLGGKKRKGTPPALSLADGSGWLLTAALEQLAAQAVGIVRHHHRAHPEQGGASLETVRTLLAAASTRPAADMALTRATESGAVKLLDRGLVSTPEFAKGRASDTARLHGEIDTVLTERGLLGMTEAEVSAACGGEANAVRVALAELSQAARARRLGGMWFGEGPIEALRDRVRAHFNSNPTLDVGAFKDLAGVSRKQAIPLLEQLDREGTTRRDGNDRVRGR